MTSNARDAAGVACVPTAGAAPNGSRPAVVVVTVAEGVVDVEPATEPRVLGELDLASEQPATSRTAVAIMAGMRIPERYWGWSLRSAGQAKHSRNFVAVAG
jgi:hypothetical protein